MRRRKVIGLLLLLLPVGSMEVLGWLTYRQARQDSLNRALIAAIQRDDLPAGMAVLRAGADPNSREDTSQPLSFWQSLRRLFAGIWKHDKPSATHPGETALMLALKYDDIQYDDIDVSTVFSPLIRALAARGADVHVTDEDRVTPLMLAAQNESTDTVCVLLAKGAEVNAGDNDGVTALMCTTVFDHADTTKVLLKRGADVNKKSVRGETALSFAFSYVALDIVQLLKQAGAKQ